MIIGVRDIVYLITYIVSLVAVIFSFRGRIGALEREVKRLSDALYQTQGGLNVVDIKGCKEHRDLIYSKVRENQSEVKQLIDKLEITNQNLTKALTYLEMLMEKKSDQDIVRD